VAKETEEAATWSGGERLGFGWPSSVLKERGRGQVASIGEKGERSCGAGHVRTKEEEIHGVFLST
jgi:hypothetical protein